MEDQIVFLNIFSILLDEDVRLRCLRNSFDTNKNVHSALLCYLIPSTSKKPQGIGSVEKSEILISKFPPPSRMAGLRAGRRNKKCGHCEERSDAAIP
jgi:hypothetical protein